MKLLLIIPTLNEVDSIGNLITDLEHSDQSFDVLIIDDCSTDGTQALVRELSDLYSRKITLLERTPPVGGLAGAYIDGYRQAASNGYTHVIQMDADGQHRVADLPGVIQMGFKNPYVIGSRYCPGGRITGWSLYRLFVSKLGNLYFRLLFNPGVKDATGGFRMSTIEILNSIWSREPTSKGFTFHAESTFRVTSLGFRIQEAPITFVSRKAGDSKMSFGSGWESLKMMFLWRINGRHYE